ncbi:MAG: hypothetical protein ACOYCE_01205 [Limnochordia bacterium]|nr:hypothetical protein [Bacillota bacterium]
MPDAKYVKYGGVRFINNASPQEINRYVRELPPKDRESLFEVIKILHDEGLITVLEDEPMTTVDQNMLPYLE